MKRFVFILTILILSVSLGLSFFYIFAYKNQIRLQKIKIEQLQQAISEIKAQKDKLSSDNDFIQSQYETLKSSKQKNELIDIETDAFDTKYGNYPKDEDPIYQKYLKYGFSLFSH